MDYVSLWNVQCADAIMLSITCQRATQVPTELRALPDHDGPFLDLATAHHAYEHGGADTLRAQTREQVIRMT